VLPFLEDLRSSLKNGTFTALPVRQVMIPKKRGKLRALGIPVLRDRVAQMALKLILEPIFEAEFYPHSYGYRLADVSIVLHGRDINYRVIGGHMVTVVAISCGRRG
jgi:hypothetical protein